MGTCKPEDPIVQETENYITINQRIILPDNYKKFSTIKLKIKPAKLIFVGSETKQENCQNQPSLEKNEGEIQVDKSRNFKLDALYNMLSSTERLKMLNEENSNRERYFLSNRKSGRVSGRFPYKLDNNENIIDEELNEESEIVKELVLGKFKDLLQKFIEKSNKRKTFSMDEEVNLDGWTGCMHFLDNFDFRSHHEGTNIQSEENDAKAHLERTNSKELAHNAQKSFLYDQKFDREDLVPLNKEKNLELLPSREAYAQSYVHVLEPMEAVQSLEFIERKPETIDNQSIVSYTNEEEWIDKEENDLEVKLKEDIYEQTSAIAQVLKVLSLCESNKKLADSMMRVEAERVLLIATLRRDILTKYLSVSDNGNEDSNGFVLLSNLRICLNQILEKNVKHTFFVCVFRYGCTVSCSELLVSNGDMELAIEDPVCFEELPTDFAITVEVYTMQLKTKERTTGKKILKKYTNLLFGLGSRPRNVSNTIEKEVSKPKTSAFTLIGSTVITKSNIQCKEFNIKNRDNNGNILKALKCTIGSGVKLDVFLSGFLMVCESCAGKNRWRRQWCILDASELKFWDYPGKEEVAAPNRIFDLSRSLLPYIMLADRKFCSRPRSLHLKMGPDSAQDEFRPKDVFLAADNPRDFLLWEKELNRVLENLINWGCMKTYFENSL